MTTPCLTRGLLFTVGGGSSSRGISGEGRDNMESRKFGNKL